MKRYLLLLVFAFLTLGATVDTKDGVTIDRATDFDGITTATTCDGQNINCDPDENEVGDRTVHDETLDLVSDRVYCMQYVADCTGTLKYGYVYHSTTDADETVKICIYSEGDADAVADASDLLLGCSGAISGGITTGWKTDSSTIGVSATKGTTYWVCIIGGPGRFNTFYETGSGTTSYYDDLAGSYADPPADLTGDGSWQTGNPRQYSRYIQIQ